MFGFEVIDHKPSSMSWLIECNETAWENVECQNKAITLSVENNITSPIVKRCDAKPSNSVTRNYARSSRSIRTAVRNDLGKVAHDIGMTRLKDMLLTATATGFHRLSTVNGHGSRMQTLHRCCAGWYLFGHLYESIFYIGCLFGTGFKKQHVTFVCKSLGKNKIIQVWINVNPEKSCINH